ncbi:MAG: DUF202 domain-containing protein [Xanthomonadales bacterium]|nr:DUF202 domain-containing protein [Xanthomonadales bacterium]
MSESSALRDLFAAERTLLAWNRTSVSLMAFGFVVERFGLFLALVRHGDLGAFQRHASFFVGEGFVLLAIVVALLSMRQHGRVLRALGGGREAAYDFRPGLWLNALVGLLGVGLSAYLVVGYV